MIKLQKEGANCGEKNKGYSSQNIVKILESDYETFKITKNYLLNYIFENMRDEILNEDINFEGKRRLYNLILIKKIIKIIMIFYVKKIFKLKQIFLEN